MGNACNQCFEGLIKSFDKYDSSNVSVPRNHRNMTTGEAEPLLQNPVLSYTGQSQIMSKNQSLQEKNHRMSYQKSQAIIEEMSDKIRVKMVRNLQSLNDSMESAQDLFQVQQEISRCESESRLESRQGKNRVVEESPRNSSPSSSQHGLELPSEFLKLYDIGKMVGIGTTAKVYQITRRKRKKVVNSVGQPVLLACKVIDKRKLTLQMNYTEMEPLLKQLRREVDILRRINHPNIVTYHDFMETKNELFIITEYLTGGELFDYLATSGSIAEEMTKYLLYDIFDAVAYLHEHKIIHRDIKAENCIFYLNAQNEIALKLIDFGFSISIQASYMTSSFLGTCGYIAPEISQNKYYNVSVDNWALGILLYCMIAGKMPFKMQLHQQDLATQSTDGDDRASQLQLALNVSNRLYKLQFPDKQWKHISSECKDLLKQLLQIDPMKRMTAKGALNHAWFRGVKEMKKVNRRKFRESQQRRPSLSGATATAVCVEASPSSIRNPFATVSFAGGLKKKRVGKISVPVPKLENAGVLVSESPIKSMTTESHFHFEDQNYQERLYQKSSRLRPSQSTLNLERRSNGIRSPPLNTSPRDESDSSPQHTTQGKIALDPVIIQSSPREDENNEDIGLFFASNDLSDTTSASEEQKQNLSSQISPELEIPKPTRSLSSSSSFIPFSISQNAGTHLNHSANPVSQQEINEVPVKPTELSTSFQEAFLLPARQNSFIWEEIHDKIAGDLFYSTYLPIHTHYQLR